MITIRAIKGAVVDISKKNINHGPFDCKKISTTTPLIDPFDCLERRASA